MDEADNSRYRTIRRLGVGGMGEVFLAEDTQLERPVALKLMSAELAKEPNQRKRFQTEARAASSLNHPNIVVVYEVGETEEGRPFLAMEYLEGQTLDSVLKQRRLKIREIISIGSQVANALSAAHARGIVHRDIKPANIMLDAHGHAKVLDFGLAKRFTQDALSDAAPLSSGITQPGMMIGTPHYMSPEQALGRELDHRSDIFSLGVVLYELAAGQKPFLGQTVGETINNIINQRPEPLGLENPIFSPALDGIIFKCLEKNPDHRYVAARSLAEDLLKLAVESERASATVTLARPGEAGITPEGDEAERKRFWRVPGAVFFGGVALLGLVLLGVWMLYHSIGAAPPSAGGAALANPLQKSVAVLAFDNFTGEPGNDYLSDGLTEEITTTLSRVPGLKVAARNSAFAFKGKKTDLREVGRALHVSTLLEGSVQKAGSRIRVSAQLINASDDSHLWGETYDREVNDIFAVEEEIARNISEKLQGRSDGLGGPKRRIDPEAHTLFLQAQIKWKQRTEPALRIAIELFQQAISKDPEYAAAYANLAATYLLVPEYSSTARSSDYNPLARAAAEKALKLDPLCADAHAVLGQLAWYEQDSKGAEEHFRRALELDPNYATAHHWYGNYLTLHDRRDEGLAHYRTALDLDALSPIIHCTIPEWYYFGRQYDRALKETRKVLDTFPDFLVAREGLARIQITKGQFSEALAGIDELRAKRPDDPLFELELRGYALARLGREDEARKIIEQLLEQRKQGKPTEGALAFVYMGLRDYDRALDSFEQALATEGLGWFTLADPLLDQVRDLPRFRALAEKAQKKT